MAQEIEFVEAGEPPRCPHCEQTLERIEVHRRQVLGFTFFEGKSWVTILSCPHCRKVIGTFGR
jgi:hypothetical protein